MKTSQMACSSADNWEIQLRKGSLELVVLACLREGRVYGLEILRGLEEQSDLAVTAGTLYPLLARLKRDGFLRSEWVDGDAGHPRKYYRLTQSGRRRLQEMTETWAKFSATLNELLDLAAKEES